MRNSLFRQLDAKSIDVCLNLLRSGDTKDKVINSLGREHVIQRHLRERNIQLLGHVVQFGDSLFGSFHKNKRYIPKKRLVTFRTMSGHRRGLGIEEST